MSESIRCDECGQSCPAYARWCPACGATMIATPVEAISSPSNGLTPSVASPRTVPLDYRPTESEESVPRLPPRSSGPPEKEPAPGIQWAKLFACAILIGVICLWREGRIVLFAMCLGLPACAVYSLSQAVVGRGFKVPILELSIAFVRVLVFSVGRTRVSIGGLPNPSSYVKFLGLEELSTPDADSQLKSGERRLNELHPLKRIAILLAGAVGMFAFASSLLGPAEAFGSTARGITQFLHVFVSPVDYGGPLFARWIGIVQTGEMHLVMGRIAAKLLAENLLPIPIALGGDVLIELVQLVLRRKLSPRKLALIQYFSMLLLVWFVVCVAIAVFAAFKQP